ncbi:MAG: TetR/AcrR family transcriptional regulator [Actinobacteria bacterium]|nr:TetR/AcrR family transcriptional regulator [Actinomycetota bacterium]
MATVRERVLDGARVAAFKFSLQRLTVEDVGRECGVSRATIYRHFLGGREQIVADLVADELDRFLTHLAVAVDGIDDVARVLAVGLMSAREFLAQHELLQRILAIEPEIVLPYLTVATDRLLELIGGFLTPFVEQASRIDDVEATCEYLARLFLSYATASGSWDLADPVAVDELIQTQFLASFTVRPKNN